MPLLAVRALVIEIFDNGDIAVRIAQNRDFLVVEYFRNRRNTLGEALAARNRYRCGARRRCGQYLTTIHHELAPLPDFASDWDLSNTTTRAPALARL